MIESAISKATKAIEDERVRIRAKTLGCRLTDGECLDDVNAPSLREILIALKAIGVKID